MKVKCDGHKICKGKTSHGEKCIHSDWHFSSSSNCCGFCGTIGEIVSCNVNGRKEKLLRLNIIQKSNDYLSE